MNDSLDSRQLKALTVLAKTGSVTKTAAELCLTHSAVSHSLRNLEEQVGCRLFLKLGKKLTLNEAGETLLLHAERVLAEMRAARATLTQLNRWGSRRLRLAAEHIFPADFLTSVLLKFHREFPGCAIHVERCGPGEGVELLQDRVVDAVLAARPAARTELEFLPLLADQFHFVVNAGHPLAAKGEPSRRDLADQPVVLLRGCGWKRKEIEGLLEARGLSLNITTEIENLETIKNFVRQTTAASLLPAWVMAPELKNRWFVSLRLGKKPMEQTWGLVHLRARPLNLAESKLWKFCGEHIASLGAS